VATSLHDLKSKRLGAIPTAAGLITRLAYERAQGAGIELEPLLDKAGLTQQQVEDVDTRISARYQINFLNLAANALQDEFLGFHLAQQLADPRRYELLYYIMASSATLGEGMQRLARYASMTNESVSLKYFEDKDIRMVTNYIAVARHLDRHQIEYWLTALIRISRKLTGYHVKPSRVRFVHRRTGNFSEFPAFVGCDIEFGAAVDEAVFPLSIVAMPIVSADPYLNKLLRVNSEEAFSRRPTKAGLFRTVVENAIAPLLPHGSATESEVASRCGLSRRAFVRRLTSENLTFSEVMHDLRRDLAMQYLADHSLSISQIAWLLGYQQVSAFTSEFKQWTGTMPREVCSLSCSHKRGDS
jgi:AraC-like DNA-binding protein